MDHAPDGPWYYQQVLLGYNYRMTELQAALGINQLRSIEDFIARRQEVRERYDAELAGLPLVLPPADEDGRSALHLYPVQLPVGQEHSRAKVFDGLRHRGIGVNVHYIPIHTQPYYRALGFQPGDFPLAESYYARALSLPMHAGLTDDEVGRVIAAVRAEIGQ
jgi:dTDP-4-amino-4,6-dideoxygalactose transaminase